MPVSRKELIAEYVAEGFPQELAEKAADKLLTKRNAELNAEKHAHREFAVCVGFFESQKEDNSYMRMHFMTLSGVPFAAQMDVDKFRKQTASKDLIVARGVYISVNWGEEQKGGGATTTYIADDENYMHAIRFPLVKGFTYDCKAETLKAAAAAAAAEKKKKAAAE